MKRQYVEISGIVVNQDLNLKRPFLMRSNSNAIDRFDIKMTQVLMTLLFITALSLMSISAQAAQSEKHGNSGHSSNAMATFVGHSNDSNKKLRVPFKYGLGMKKFKENCSVCHGEWAGGTKQGPPLTHDFYKRSHHGDESFYRAALTGVRAHHWKFGNMPVVPGITRKDVSKIVPYVRWLQKQKGIY